MKKIPDEKAPQVVMRVQMRLPLEFKSVEGLADEIRAKSGKNKGAKSEEDEATAELAELEKKAKGETDAALLDTLALENEDESDSLLVRTIDMIFIDIIKKMKPKSELAVDAKVLKAKMDKIN